MNRRQWLQNVPLVGAALVTGMPLQNLDGAVSAEAHRLADFLLSPKVTDAFALTRMSAVAIPFATQPLNYRLANANHAVVQAIGSRLDDLVSEVRADNTTMLKTVLRCIWDRVRPQTDGCQQIPEIGAKKIFTPDGKHMPVSRVHSPKCVIDTDELDGAMLARILRCPVALAAEMKNKIAQTQTRYSAGHGHDGKVTFRYSPMGIQVVRAAYMLELFVWTNSANHVG